MPKAKRGCDHPAGCPIGSLFQSLAALLGPGAETGAHLKRSQLELLKALRAWADGRIGELEGRRRPGRGKRITKIAVD
jgi:hypothetical protein